MLKLDKHITLDDDAISSPNLCERFSAGDLAAIGKAVVEGYEQDEYSRRKWKRRTQAAMDLAMQVQKDKNFPWPGCSNVAFPLVTIAALQFHSRAYPAIIPGKDVVKCQVYGEDPTGERTGRADRVGTFMSWQVLEEDKAWEEQKDRLLINLPIVGTTFTKTYYDPDKGYKVDETVLAQDLVLDYWAKSVETCPRKTHLIPMTRNYIHTNVKREVFRNVLEENWYQEIPPPPKLDAAEQRRNNRRGVEPPLQSDETTPFIGLEQHVDMDLDGDGYAEPYIITVERESQFVLRIVTGFDRPEDIERNRAKEIVQIRRMEYFTKYSFIPSPDGGIYDVGFGVLLGPLNETVNTIINQLIDVGTMQGTKGGFLGRGAKIRGGVYTMAPFQWVRVDTPGDDLRKNLVPLEVGEPSQVLFALLGLLINYVNRVAGTTDPMVGESPGQNTPAETTRTMVAQGAKIYSAVFKRVWRSMKEEFKKDFVTNAIYLPVRRRFGQGQLILREDFLGNPDDIAPVADPNITSEEEALRQALTLKQFAATTPGYDPDQVERRVLKAMKIDAIDQIFPGVAKTGAPKDVKLQIAEMRTQVDMAKLQQQQQEFVATLMEERRLNEATIIKIMADIENDKVTQAGDLEDRQIGKLNAYIGMLKTRNEAITKQLDVVIKQMEVRRAEIELESGNMERLAAASGNGKSTESRAAA